MAGENKIAQSLVQGALQAADKDNAMSREILLIELLTAALKQLAAYNSREQLESMIDFRLDNIDENEFVITRGC